MAYKGHIAEDRPYRRVTVTIKHIYKSLTKIIVYFNFLLDSKFKCLYIKEMGIKY